MPRKSAAHGTVLSLLAAGVTLLIAGCGTDDIQFNGGIFDAVGLSDAAKVKTSEPKLAERAPLVVPPTLDRLPAPGDAPTAQVAGITDADAAKQKSKAQLEAQQAEFCKKNFDDARMRGDATAYAVEGPLGPCRPSVLTAVKKWNQGDSADDAQ